MEMKTYHCDNPTEIHGTVFAKTAMKDFSFDVEMNCI